MVEFSLDITPYALLRFLGISAVLFVLYYLLFEGKAVYRHCRLFLLLSVFFSIGVTILRIPVYEPEPLAVATDTEPAKSVMPASGTVESVPPPADHTDETAVKDTPERESVPESTFIADLLQNKNLYLIAGILYLIVSMALLVRFILQTARIRQLKRWGSHEVISGLTVVRNNRVQSPFSFFRTVYIDRKLGGEKLDVILMHEKSHIDHKHYIDTFLMEILVVVLWFNPFIWLVRRELRALHEYEVDHSLLAGKIELSKYQGIIFEELMGYSPDIANGFHNSLIKKRFIMMKKGLSVKYGLVRNFLIVPVLCGVLVLFSFTEKKSATLNPVENESVVAVLPEPEVHAETLPAEVFTKRDTVLPERVVQAKDKLVKLREAVSETLVAIKVTPQAADVPQPVQEEKDDNNVDLTAGQVVVSRLPFSATAQVCCIDTDDKETRVTIAVPVFFDRNWLHFSKGFCIIDKKKGDVYKIRSLARNVEMNKVLWVNGQQRRMLEFTMIFPPLSTDVKTVDMYEYFPEEGSECPSNGNPWIFRDLKVKDFRPDANRFKYYDRDGRPKINPVAGSVDLRDDQVVVTPERHNQTEITRIELSGKETLVTIALPVFYDRHWIQFGKGYCITDRKSGTTYKIRSVKKGIELNKTLWIVGKGGKSVEFTMVFPPLGPKVRSIDLYSKYPEEDALAPSNGTPWDWRDIKIADYLRTTGKVYR